MPAEWELQEAIWVTWPHYEETWDYLLPQVEDSYTQWVLAMHAGQKVHLIVKNAKMGKMVAKRLEAAGVDLDQVHFFQITNVDTWIRDYGPTFVVNPKADAPLAMVKWTFNAWGGKYDDLARDNIVPYAMNEVLRLPMFEPGIQLEGGSIDVNGAGTVMTTEQCLLNPNRNPHLSRDQIERYLGEYLNVSHVLWLKEGVEGDDTDGHVDDIARFVNPTTVLCAVEDDPNDENYAPLQANCELLQSMTDQDGNPLTIIKLPMPGVVQWDGPRLPASYTNFYIGNEVVAVPTFGHENDEEALRIIQEQFATRKVVGIPAAAIVFGLGTLHCCSQQQPKSP
jgi:agmatine deiminase